uniref:OSJNBa0072D08.1 protein n=2 Tax=Oryza sativa subsp. japonica TaxID=39947 RepID=Q7XWG0_ORYSJ|nr:OSJNBb0012A12.16 [Oryza sativa Japonica Group]CAE02499.1 OSJNBa0072D08.1 [Oryza sativa Japonica Group]
MRRRRGRWLLDLRGRIHGHTIQVHKNIKNALAAPTSTYLQQQKASIFGSGSVEGQENTAESGDARAQSALVRGSRGCAGDGHLLGPGLRRGIEMRERRSGAAVGALDASVYAAMAGSVEVVFPNERRCRKQWWIHRTELALFFWKKKSGANQMQTAVRAAPMRMHDAWMRRSSDGRPTQASPHPARLDSGRGVQQKSTGAAGLLVPSSDLVQPLPAVAHDMAGQSSHEHDVIVGDRGADGKQRTQISEFMTMEEDVAGAIDANANGDDNTLCRIVPEEMADKAPNQANDKVAQTLILPQVGMAFDSKQKAYFVCLNYIGEDLNNASEDEDEDVGDVCGQSSTMDANDVCGQSSTMAAYDVYGQSSTMAAYDGFGQSSTMDAPLIQGGFTSLLFGVQQDSAMAARKLHFN